MIRKLLKNSYADVKKIYDGYKNLETKRKKPFIKNFMVLIFLVFYISFWYYLSFFIPLEIIPCILLILLYFYIVIDLLNNYNKEIRWFQFVIYKYLHKKGVAIVKIFNGVY